MRKAYCSVFLVTAAASASAMPLSVFLPKAEALNKKGPMALFSSDLGVIKKQFTTTATQVRRERLAAVKAGGKPAYCPPDKAKFDSDELLAYLRSVPPAQRNMTFTAAYKSFLVRKWPCSA